METFPDKHESVEDFLETLKYAFLYAKTVTLGPTHWPKTNAVMLRNRRIGCSMSGLAQVRAAGGWMDWRCVSMGGTARAQNSQCHHTVPQFLARRGMGELRQWCELGYQFIQECDQAFSEWLAVPHSIKTTSIKPSGTVSLLAGATPGIHFPESRYALTYKHVVGVRASH